VRPYLAVVGAVVWKDLVVEARSREVVPPVLVFGAVVLVVFHFAFEVSPRVMEVVAPGVLWLAFTFAGVLGLGRSFALERERSALEGLAMAPVDRSALFLGKVLATFLFLLAVQALLFPLFSALFNFSFGAPGLWVMGAVASLGFSAVGTLFSAMASSARARELLLPLLVFPVAVPLLISAVEGSASALRGEPLAGMARWLILAGIFDILMLTAGALGFGALLEE